MAFSFEFCKFRDKDQRRVHCQTDHSFRHCCLIVVHFARNVGRTRETIKSNVCVHKHSINLSSALRFHCWLCYRWWTPVFVVSLDSVHFNFLFSSHSRRLTFVVFVSWLFVFQTTITTNANNLTMCLQFLISFGLTSHCRRKQKKKSFGFFSFFFFSHFHSVKQYRTWSN